MSKKNNQAARQLKPEEYIRLKVRQLPVYKCYKYVNHFEDRKMCIIVIRQHPQGNFTFEAYMINLPGRTICDGSVAAFAIGILVSTGAIEHLPLIEELYATGLVDESCEGHIDEVRKSIREPWPAFPLPPMNPRAIRDDYKHQFQKEKS